MPTTTQADEATANLRLPYILSGQAQKHVTHNEALRMLDALAQVAVASVGETAPPADPAEGERHIVGAGASGAWAGADGALAAWQDGAWIVYRPRAGWLAHEHATGRTLVHDGTDWTPLAATLPDDAWRDREGLGIGTGFDETNRLAVAAPATLLTHAGGGHQVKVNKASPSETASLLFQTDWSGRAEIGTAGGDDLSIKVSADGTGWMEALRVDAATASVRVTRLVMAGAIGVDNYFGRASDYPAGLPANLSPVDFLMSGGVNNDFVFASNGNNNAEGLVFGRLLNGAFDEQMRLDAIRGRLGVGTARPTTALHVEGPVRLGRYDPDGLPAAATVGEGTVVYVRDPQGAHLAVSDGTAWRRLAFVE